MFEESVEIEDPVFVIAEIGSNHNQDINRAYELIDAAKEAGADAVKFQSLNLEKLIDQQDITDDDRELFRHIELSEQWYDKLFAYTNKKEIECISAPTYLDAIPLLVHYGAHYIKIASPQTYGFPEVIKQVAQTGLKTIMSTGYCDEEEIDRAVSHFLKYGKRENLMLLHCVSQYPTEISNVNLRYMYHLKEKYQLPVGFSDHTEGISVAGGAAALGAKVIEKHITLSKKDEGPDHFFALEPEEFTQMVKQIREIEKALGKRQKELTSFEKDFRETVVMYPYANKRINAGQIIREEDISYYRSKQKGISPWEVDEKLIGKKIAREIKENSKLM